MMTATPGREATRVLTPLEGVERRRARTLQAASRRSFEPAQDDRRYEPDERTGALAGQVADVDAANTALLERQRAPGADQVSRQFASSGSWPTMAMRRRLATLARFDMTA